MTVHPPPARPPAPQENQCSISHYLASLEAQENWYCTHIAHQSCDQLTAVKQGIRWSVLPDRIAGSGVDPSRTSIFMKLSADKSLVYKWLRAQVYFFKIHLKYVVFMCRTIKILNSKWPRMRKFRQLLQTGKTVAFNFSPWSRVGHALRPIFMLWLVKIWQVSSCRKFIQHLETCLLWQLKLTEFCVNLWCF